MNGEQLKSSGEKSGLLPRYADIQLPRLLRTCGDEGRRKTRQGHWERESVISKKKSLTVASCQPVLPGAFAHASSWRAAWRALFLSE
jgi:hypothetical protein